MSVQMNINPVNQFRMQQPQGSSRNRLFKKYISTFINNFRFKMILVLFLANETMGDPKRPFYLRQSGVITLNIVLLLLHNGYPILPTLTSSKNPRVLLCKTLIMQVWKERFKMALSPLLSQSLLRHFVFYFNLVNKNTQLGNWLTLLSQLLKKRLKEDNL